MKSLLVTLATSIVLSVAGAGMILFACAVVGFACADYARRPRLALRPVAAVAPRAARIVRTERESPVSALIRTATTSPFQTISA